ncbi:hypothetical protein M8R20_07410 [Pseudomonas sp. R2.Fl]|nr:hypothetical protein [Pseudomonas sp. R2.Fl]
MAKDSGALISFRVENDLKEQFVRAAGQNKQSTSRVLRDLVQSYVADERRKEIARQVANINAQKDDEEDVMRFIAAVGTSSGDDD